MKFKRRRRAVEIYFILYLAALVFLIPDKKDENQNKDKDRKVFQLPFSLQPEKAALICKMVMDSTGPKVISIDSVNTIFYSGNVKDVEFEFTVIDESIQGSLELTSDKPLARNFRIEELHDRQAATFAWSPPENISSNKTYIVKVKAIAKTTEEDRNSDMVGNSLTYRTQFSLNILFVSKTGSDSGNISIAANQADGKLPFGNIFNLNTIPSGDFTLWVSNPKVEEIASGFWSNSIYANNINLARDVLKGPEITIKLQPEGNGGSAQLAEKKDGEIVLRGKVPNFGTMTVEIKVIRKRDAEGMAREFKTTFKVQPRMIQQAKFERNMYPDVNYEINPNLPLMGKPTRALLRDENIVRVQSQGERFTFTPDAQDIDKTLLFERYIDTMLLDRNKIRILDYPEPEILNLVETNRDTIQVITRSLGLFKKEYNEVVYFIVEGNAKFKDIRGYFKYNSKDNTIIQYFNFTPKDPGKPFRFTIRAVDKRGKVSLIKRYGWE